MFPILPLILLAPDQHSVIATTNDPYRGAGTAVRAGREIDLTVSYTVGGVLRTTTVYENAPYLDKRPRPVRPSQQVRQK